MFFLKLYHCSKRYWRGFKVIKRPSALWVWRWKYCWNSWSHGYGWLWKCLSNNVIGDYCENTPSGHTSFDGETDITDIEKTEENSPVMHINILWKIRGTTWLLCQLKLKDLLNRYGIILPILNTSFIGILPQRIGTLLGRKMTSV